MQIVDEVVLTIPNGKSIHDNYHLYLQMNETKTKRFWNDKLEVQYQKVKMDPTFPLKVSVYIVNKSIK